MSGEMDTTIGIGVIGMGFMGTTHVAAYERAARDRFPSRVVTVADPRKRASEPRDVRNYTDAAAVFADPSVHLVSICTPTDTHVTLATAALRAGKHVLLEKPVALHADEIQQLRRIAIEMQRICMPAMCMRFWPAWKWVKDRIDDGTFGAVRSAEFRRVCEAPTWSPAFYANRDRSGGALVDLHIHDADFIRYCFGEPSDVSSAGSIDHVTTTYRFDRRDGAPERVIAEGGWLAPGTPFRMAYIVRFDRATADFDSSREPQLLLTRDGKTEPVVPENAGLDGYDMEIRYVLRCALERRIDTSPNLDDAIAVARLLDAERESLMGKTG